MKRRMTLQEVIDLEPCWLEEDREAGIERIRRLFGRRKYATPQRILAADISNEDKLWLLLREPFFTEQQLALIACDFAEAVLPIYEAEFPGDTRPRKAINTVRRYARGACGMSEMSEMRAAAWAAAWAAGDAAEAARDAAWVAAWAAWVDGAAWVAASAAKDAAWVAASAAKDAAWVAKDAAWAAAEAAEAARDAAGAAEAAWAAAGDAAWAAAWADAGDAAWEATRAQQLELLETYL